MEPQLSKSEEPSASQEFNPKPEEWWNAVLTHVNTEKKTLTATLTTGERVWTHERDVTFCPHGHYLCLPCDGSTQMSVRIERQNHRLYPFRALEAQIAVDEFEPLRERGVILNWLGNVGSIRRPCKCGIFAKSGSETIHLDGGDEVEFDVEWSDFKQKFIAQHITLVKRHSRRGDKASL